MRQFDALFKANNQIIVSKVKFILDVLLQYDLHLVLKGLIGLEQVDVSNKQVANELNELLVCILLILIQVPANQYLLDPLVVLHLPPALAIPRLARVVA